MWFFREVRAENLGESVSRPGDLEFVVRFTPITAFNLQPLTFNLQPLTFNLQPSTFSFFVLYNTPTPTPF